MTICVLVTCLWPEYLNFACFQFHKTIGFQIIAYSTTLDPLCQFRLLKKISSVGEKVKGNEIPVLD
jgi:hypothetical protein